MDFKEVGKVIKQIRNKKGYTQTELAKMINSSRSLIAQIERGAMRPSLETLSNIAEKLGVTSSYIILKAEGAVAKDYELIMLKNELPEGIAVLKKANEELTEKQKKDVLELMDFYIRKELERKEGKK